VSAVTSEPRSMEFPASTGIYREIAQNSRKDTHPHQCIRRLFNGLQQSSLTVPSGKSVPTAGKSTDSSSSSVFIILGATGGSNLELPRVAQSSGSKGLAVAIRSNRYVSYGSSFVARGPRGPYTARAPSRRYLSTVLRDTPSSRAIALIDFPCHASTLTSTTVSKLSMASPKGTPAYPLHRGQLYFDEGGVSFAPALTTS